MKVLISGGGTGGHIYPAIAIADKIVERNPEASILFVGATGKMEMEKVPKAGYKIEGLPVRGLQRKLTLRNLTFPFRLIWSLIKVRKIVKKFSPDVVVGVGGYASGPSLRVANSMGIATLIQEQNSYPGLTNKLLSKKVKKICVAYPDMERFFPKEKISMTGNPVRASIKVDPSLKSESKQKFDLDPSKKTILLFGGSLGARTLNDAMKGNAGRIEKRADVEWIWQMGSLYFDEYKECETAKLKNVKPMAFIDDMGKAYNSAELAITRAGALSVSELALVEKACILIPSPNVAEDHQTKNAEALVKNGAARMVKDRNAKEELVVRAFELLDNTQELKNLEEGIKSFAKPNATEEIVDEIFKLCH